MRPTIRLLSATRIVRGTPPNEHLSPIHLCRALLREASYLPDATARDYFRRFILWRFQSYQPVDKGARWFREINKRPKTRLRVVNIDSRASEKLRKGRQALSLLRRANTGDRLSLRRVLLAAFGRVGRRRHELIQPLLQPAAPVNSDMLQDIMAKTSDTHKKPLKELYHDDSRVLSFFAPPKQKSKDRIEIAISKEYAKLDAIISANGHHRPRDSPRSVVRSTSLIAPALNHWGRPMPVKRAKNMVRKWYKNALERLLPPLPDQEWDRLHGLALGHIKWEGLIPRRPVGTVRPEITGAELMSDTSFALRGVSGTTPELEHAKHRLLQDLYPPKSTSNDSRHNQSRARITPRFMQRMYQNIATLCCKLVWDSTRNKWTVVWGSLAIKEHHGRVWSRPTTNIDLFAGVDERGQLPKAPRDTNRLQDLK